MLLGKIITTCFITNTFLQGGDLMESVEGRAAGIRASLMGYENGVHELMDGYKRQVPGTQEFSGVAFNRFLHRVIQFMDGLKLALWRHPFTSIMVSGCRKVTTLGAYRDFGIACQLALVGVPKT